MGTFLYDDHGYKLDDRLLAHLQVVISMKLRRGESFFLSWVEPAATGGGRNAVWIDNGVAIRFRFDGSRPPAINREWAESLALSANTNNGLVIMDELTPPEP